MNDGYTFDLFGDSEPHISAPAPSVPKPHPALASTAALMALFERWVARGWLRDLDRALASFFAREASDAPPLLLLAAALASHQLGRGHVCLDLSATLDSPDFALSLPPEGDDLVEPPPLPSDVLDTLTLKQWQAALAHPTLVGEGSGNTPLVRADTAHTTRLYLRRYWQYEQTLHQEIAARLAAPEQDEPEATAQAQPGHAVSRHRDPGLAKDRLRPGIAQPLRDHHRRPRHRQDHHRGAPAGPSANPATGRV